MDRNTVIAKTMLKLAGIDSKLLKVFETDSKNLIDSSKRRNFSDKNIQKALGKHLLGFSRKHHLENKDSIKALLEIIQKTGALKPELLADESKKMWDNLLRGFGLRLPA